jgi:hypothetical protein
MSIVKRGVEDALKLNVEEINRDRIYIDFALHNEKNYVDLLGDIGNYLIPFDDEYFYSEDSTWVKFFKENVDNWFGDDHGCVVIDEEYWLLSFADTIEGVANWDISRIDLDNLEPARKLVKLLSIVEEIGSSMNGKDST